MEDKVEIAKYLSEINTVSPRSSLVIAGASFYLQYKRTRSLAIDSTATWKSLADATRYAQNIDTTAYVPYDGQMITVKEEGKTNIYVLVIDESLPKDDGRVHCKLEPVASMSYADDRYLRKGIKDTLEKGFTSKDTCDIEGGLNVGKLTKLSGGVVVTADTNYSLAESEKENPENKSTMAIGLTEIPGNGSGFGSSSLGEMDNTDESFDTVPDGNYIMQKRAGVFYPVKSAATGGGTKLTLAFVTPSNATVVHGKETLIKYTYSSTLSGEETGEGIATYTLNNKQVASETINQGEVSFNIGKYLILGDNILVVQVTDSYGATRKLTFKINAVSISVTSTFDDSKAYVGAISFVYTPVGSLTKVIHFKIDDKEIGTVETAISNRQQTYSIPAQSHGAHTLEVYATATIDETDIESEHLIYDIICISSGSNTPVIASSFKMMEIEQYDTLLIPFIVYSPASSSSEITLSANGQVVSTQTVDRTRQSWSYRANDAGALTLTITCGNTSKTFNVNVTESPIIVEPETQDLELYLTSQNRSNSDTDKEEWSYNDVAATFSGFNWKNNGWVKDDNGYSCLRVSGGASVALPLHLFASDFRATGKTIEFEFIVRDVYNYDTPVISCWSGDRGIQITSQTALLKSEQSSIDTRFKDEERIRLAFVVEKRADNRLVGIYVNGIKSGSMQYPDADNFMQSVPVDIAIGCPDATIDIYNIRSYNNNLNRYQLLDNYIADMDDVEKKRDLYLRNQIYDDYGSVSFQKVNKMIDCLVFEGDLPQYKGDKKTNKVYLFSSANSSLDWIADIKNNVQGTSSQYYPRKNNKFEFIDGITYTETGMKEDSYQVTDDVLPAAVFCVKTDFAESSGTHNTGVANMIDTMLKEMNILTDAQKADPKVRTTVAGRPCLLFHKETADSVPVFIGKVNLNTDKAAENTFGFKAGDESWEFLNNTSDLTLFKTGDMTGWENNIEARYLDGNTDITNVRKVFEWVNSCKGNIEKFKSEFDQYFDKEQVVFYALITLALGMTDQRAKNMFLTKIGNGRWMFIFYDNDTLLPINNEALITFLYNVEISDVIGNKNVWNGADSELWKLVEEAFADDIREMYYTMRQRGILSYDRMIEYLYKRQAEKWSEAIYNEDGYFKYEQPLTEGYLDYSQSHENPQIVKTGAYLYALQGSRELYGKWIWKNRFLYLDSKFLAGSVLGDTAVFRTYTPAVWTGIAPCADITLTSFNAMYFNVKWGSVTRSQRVGFNDSFKMIAPEGMTFNDTETIIYGASLITSLGDLSALYPGSVDVSKMTRLKELIIGSTVEGYQNQNMTVLYVGNNRMLKLLNMANCPNYTQPIDVSGCDNLEELYAQGSATTAVLLPAAGNMRTMHLPETVTSLTMLNQINITDAGLILDGVQNLSTIRWENTNKANVLSIIDRCFALDSMKLERVRLIGVDWTLSTLDPIIKLISLKGLDENGNNVDKAIITGKCYVSVATDSQINKLKAAFPELTVTYGQLKPAPVTTFTFSSSQYKTIKNSAFECDYEVEKVNEYTYKVTSEDNITIDFTFKCENHEDFKGSYLVAGTRSQSYTVTYIPLRKIRVGVYNQSIYVQGATVTIGDQSYISDADGYITLPRGGTAISGTVSAYGYASNTFSYGSITSDTTNTVYVYGVVDVKFIVKYNSLLIEGATVKCNGVTGTTNQYGECTFSLGKGTYQYSVTHDTYYEKTGNITVGTSATSLTVYVEPNTVEVKFIVKDGTVLLSGATIQCDGKTGITDTSGETTLVISSKKTHEYTISKNGYFSVTDNVTVSLTAITVNAAMTIDIESFKPIENGNIQMLVTGENVSLYVTSDATDYIISWGDGTEDHAVGTGELTYDHTYDNSDFHQVEIKSCSDVTYAITKNSLSLVAYWDLGNSNVNNLSFSGFSMLKYVGLVLKNDTERQYFSYCFNNTGLTSIPQGLLDNCVAATSLSNIFTNTLISSIPAGLFDHCTKANTFRSAFKGALISSIPDDLFRYNVSAYDFSLCFANTKITSVPERLFYYCTNALYFGGVDSWNNPEGCFSHSLLESIPANLFINNKNVSDFRGCFQYSKIKDLPAGLIDNCPVTTMDYFCYECKMNSVILPSISSNLGRYSFSSLGFGLKYIISNSVIPQTIETTTIDNANIYHYSIYVPDESVDNYKTATNWTALADRIKPMSQFATDFPNEEV